MKRKKSIPQHAFHVTRTSNIRSIMARGLLPLIGPFSKLAQEKEPRVYLFASIDDVETALMNWLGDIFDDTALSLLMIDTTDIDLDITAGYELSSTQTITADKIVVITQDIDNTPSLLHAYKHAQNGDAYLMEETSTNQGPSTCYRPRGV